MARYFHQFSLYSEGMAKINQTNHFSLLFVQRIESYISAEKKYASDKVLFIQNVRKGNSKEYRDFIFLIL